MVKSWTDDDVFLLCFDFNMFTYSNKTAVECEWGAIWLEIALIKWLAIWFALIIESMIFGQHFSSFGFSVFKELKKNRKLGAVYWLCAMCVRVNVLEVGKVWIFHWMIRIKKTGGRSILMRQLSHTVFVCHWFWWNAFTKSLQPIKVTSVELNICLIIITLCVHRESKSVPAKSH